MRNVLRVSIIGWIALIVAITTGCVTTAPKKEQQQAKYLSAPFDKALIYVFREPAFQSSLRGASFEFSGKRLGWIGVGQYLYFFHYPAQIIMFTKPGVPGPSFYAKAGREYYLAIKVKAGGQEYEVRLLSEAEGRQYLNSYELSGEFTPVVFGAPPPKTPAGVFDIEQFRREGFDLEQYRREGIATSQRESSTRQMPETAKPPTVGRSGNNTPLVKSKLVKPSPLLVSKIQTLLRRLNYDPGSSDGLAGPKTVAAVKEFQRGLGLQPTGTISQELLVILQSAVLSSNSTKAPPPEKEPSLTRSGSGFFVNKKGLALTNYHVIDECDFVTITLAGKRTQATVVAVDRTNDLAVLSLAGSNTHSSSFRDSRQVSLGETVYVSGFPLRGLLSGDMNFTNGTVSAVSGAGDDARLLQISAPVQQGNSGGPLLDNKGNVIGVVVSKLNAAKVLKATGDIPQNINFAVKGVLARGFLDIHSIEYETAESTVPIDPTMVATKARQFTVPVECWKDESH